MTMNCPTRLQRKSFRSLASCALLATGASAALYDTVIETQYGLIQGYPAFNSTPAGNLTNWKEITVWKNIPFAATTGGQNRWKAPQPVANWSGTLDASSFGNVCPSAVSTMGDSSYTIDEDCLNLNIWSAASSPDAKLPVVMWSYPAMSTAADALFDGGGIADKGVVFVNYNYRAGSFGWLAHPELSEEFMATTVTANAVYNASFSSSDFFPASSFDYCNVTLAYSHDGLDDRVLLEFWLPAPDKFENRWLSTGGGGMAINSGSNGLPAGVQYEAATGMTDGGFGGFSAQATDVMLLGNGTINYNMLYAFGYMAHHEMTTIGKAFTKNFFSMGDEKLYAYYFACSEGGREGYIQVQRFADDWDGAVIGAPAIRYGQQQVNHIYANVVQKTIGYYPPPCELEKIVNLTISACDPLDGKTDSLVARTDLCKLHYNISTTVGESYSCAASGSAPAQTGKVTKKGVAVAKKILDGLLTLDGRRAYLYYQPAASFDDAATTYNSTSKQWEGSISGLSTSWITMFLELQEVDTMTSLEGVTYDTLKDWMEKGMQRYDDVLQTTWPDLSPFQSAGGKIIHIHGESDPSIPSASSVRYHESVRQIMYPKLSFEKGHEAMNDWNRLYLVPGGAHCSPSSNQDGPWPQNSIRTLINWVEKDQKPGNLEATFLSGDKEGETQEVCVWPQRPLWTNGGQDMECVFDQKSYDSWIYDFDAYKMPVY